MLCLVSLELAHRGDTNEYHNIYFREEISYILTLISCKNFLLMAIIRTVLVRSGISFHNENNLQLGEDAELTVTKM